MTFLEVLKRIDECKEGVTRGNGPSFLRQTGYDENYDEVWRELRPYNEDIEITAGDIFATDWEEF